MAKKQRQPFVTGDKELDAILRTFPDKEVRQAVRKSTRATVKGSIAPRYRQNVERAGLVDRGAMRGAGKAKAVKRSRTQYGTQFTISETEAENASGGSRQRDAGQPFRYIWAWEFGEDPTRLRGLENIPRTSFKAGNQIVTAVAPQRRALFESKQETLADFRTHLRAAIGAVAARAKLRQIAQARGATVFKDVTGRFQRVKGGFAKRIEIAAARDTGKLLE